MSEITMYDIIKFEIDKAKCENCPILDIDKKSKDKFIADATRNIQKAMIEIMLPPMLKKSFTLKTPKEKISYFGGYNNCRTMVVRRIRKFCKMPEKEKIQIITTS